MQAARRPSRLAACSTTCSTSRSLRLQPPTSSRSYFTRPSPISASSSRCSSFIKQGTIVPRRFSSGQLPKAPKIENPEDIPFEEPYPRRVPYTVPPNWIDDPKIWHFYGEYRYENHPAAIRDLIKRGRVPGILFGRGLPTLMLHFPISTFDIYIHRDLIGPGSKFKLILPNRDCWLVDTLTTRAHPKTDKAICVSMYRETIEPLKWQGSMELPRGNRYPKGAFKKATRTLQVLREEDI